MSNVNGAARVVVKWPLSFRCKLYLELQTPSSHSFTHTVRESFVMMRLEENSEVSVTTGKIKGYIVSRNYIKATMLVNAKKH